MMYDNKMGLTPNTNRVRLCPLNKDFLSNMMAATNGDALEKKLVIIRIIVPDIVSELNHV